MSSDLRPTSFTSVLKIEEKIVPKDEPATEASSNVQVNTYFNQTNIVEYQDNEKKVNTEVPYKKKFSLDV